MPTAPPTHQPHGSRWARKRERQRRYDNRRGSSAARGYGYRWRKARKAYLAANPLCVECAKRDEVVAATDVDHIVPHHGDAELFWNQDNWQSLCHTCHSRKTATEDSAFAASGGEGRVKSL